MPGNRAAVTHDLKCWSWFFRDVAAGIKTFEIRRNDRDFHEGDLIVCREYEPHADLYTGRRVCLSILKVYHEVPGLESGYCAMQIRITKNAK